MKLDRLLSIVMLLLNRERVTAKCLAERFEVTVRTIYRDLESINAAGIPVVACTGPKGGFGLDPSYTIDRGLMSPDDLRSVLAALKGVNSALGDSALGSAIEKMTNLAPRGRVADLLEERVAIDLFPWGRREEERRLVKTIGAAIAERRLLRFDYSSYGREAELRTVEPMTLVFKAYAWYLWGFCRLRQDFRLFKLTRMRDLERTGGRFARRPDSYPGDQMPEAGSPLSVRLRFEPGRAARAEEWFWGEETARLADGSVEVALVVPEGGWLVDLLLGLGPGLRVLEPQSLRLALAEAALSIAAQNK